MKIAYNNQEIANNSAQLQADTQVLPQVTSYVNPRELYTLIMYDPDAPVGTYLHWWIANIRPTGRTLQIGPINNASYDTITEYMGPAPPKGSGRHRYIFHLYRQSGVYTPETPKQRYPLDIQATECRYRLHKVDEFLYTVNPDLANAVVSRSGMTNVWGIFIVLVLIALLASTIWITRR